MMRGGGGMLGGRGGDRDAATQIGKLDGSGRIVTRTSELMMTNSRSASRRVLLRRNPLHFLGAGFKLRIPYGLIGQT